ncbi:MAG: glycosyltransferase family 2 protein [Chloroflexales bacterium]|nr:glycosyltransferase family 2 protein [Chloroflexales bacterium]
MTPLVTVAIPVYKRLNYLPGALRSVAAQDYPHIELIVSDNGENGDIVEATVAAHYSGPFTVRRNPRTVDIVTHFNQLIAAAQGAYFTLLSDDDEISPNFVSELLGLLERYPQAAVGLARVEAFSEDGGQILGATDERPLPAELMSDLEFVRGWCAYAHKYISFTTNLSRTADLRAVGGYPPIERANGADNALLVKQCLGRAVAFSAGCTFRHRIHTTSFGKAADVQSLALSSRQFLSFLDHDPRLRALRRTRPADYAELRRLLQTMLYDTYLGRWKGLYRSQIPTLAWMRAGLALPAHPTYIREIFANMIYALPGFSRLARQVRRLVPRGAR